MPDVTKTAILLVTFATMMIGGAGTAGSFTTPSSTVDGGGVARSAIVFVSDRQGVDGLYAVNTDGTGLKKVLTNASDPRWSPDGGKLSFERGNDVYVMDRRGGRPRRLAAVNPSYYAWSPAGRLIATVGRDASGDFILTVVDVAVQQAARLSNAKELEAPSWSADGSKIAFVREDEDAESSIYVINVDGSGLARLVKDATAPVWSPDGRHIAFRRSEGDVVLGEEYVHVVNADGTGERRLVDTPGFRSVDWSPDGRRIALSDASALSAAARGTFVVNVDGTGLRRISSRSGAEWSPDGGTIAATDGDIWVMGVDGTGARRITSGHRYGFGNGDVEWDPLELTTASLRGRRVPAWIVPQATASPRTLRSPGQVIALAADGGRVAVGLEATSTTCDHVEVWSPPSRSVVAFAGDRNCGRGQDEPGGLLEAAIAGTRAAWLTYTQTNQYTLYLNTATLARRRPVDLGSREDDEGQGDLQGDRALLVFDTWAGTNRRGKVKGVLWRIAGSRAVRIAAARTGLTPVSVDRGRIAVLIGRRTLAVLSAKGRTLRRFRLRAGEIQDAKLESSHLVTLTGGALIDAARRATPARRYRLRGQGTLDLEDLHAGIAVYRSGRTLHLLRLSDGRTASLTPPGRGAVAAKIESAGLFYSYNLSRARGPGRVVFVPFDALTRRFR